MKIGIDFGVSFTKIIVVSGVKTAVILEKQSEPLTRSFLQRCVMDASAHFDESIDEILVTGTKSALLPDEFDDIALTKITEWDAITQGFTTLSPDKECVLAHMGSGTSIFLINESSSKRVGGTALGGTTIDKFSEYFDIDTASKTNGETNVHANVSELVHNLTGLRGDWPGVYFHKLTPETPPVDILKGIETMVADEIINLSFMIMKATMTRNIAFSGGLTKNKRVMDRLHFWVKEFNLSIIQNDLNTYIPLIGLVGKPHTIKISLQ